MKNLKNISLFKVLVFLIISIYTRNITITLIFILLLLISDYKSCILYILIFSICYLNNYYLLDYIKIGVVDSTNTSYAVVDKFIYKVKVYENSDLNIGDIVYFSDESIRIDDESNIKYNYRFSYSKDLKVICNLVTRKKASKAIETFDDTTKAYIKKIIINENDINADLEYIGYGFALYYLLTLISKKDKRICLILIFLYLLFFEFNIKLYLVLLELLVKKIDIDRLNKLFIEILIILVINPYLLINNSFLISFIYSLIFNSKYKTNKYVLAIVQSIFFYEVKILSSIFYKYIIYSKIALFMLSIFVLIFPSISNVYLLTLSVYSKLLSVLDISVRGKISFIYIAIIFVLSRVFNINNNYIKIALICLILLTINNPFAHISYIDVGQGDATLFHDSFSKTNILIDTGSKYNYSKLRKSLYKEGIYTIDYLIITHEDEDHSGNINNLKKDFNVKEIILEGRDIETLNYYFKYLKLGNFENDNDNSLVYLVKSNYQSFLFTGDISSSVENILINSYGIRDIDILKVSHHGSNSASSNYFIGNLKPRFATISTNGKYNHPSKEVIETLNSYLVDTYITKECGTIRYYIFDSFSILVTEKNEFVII